MATRGGATARKGSPRQALDYITDGHDRRRDPGYSDGELAYIARMGDGWKTDLEGGRVPLTGFGLLAGESDEAKMGAEFEASCLPTDCCATIGYKSITFTLCTSARMLVKPFVVDDMVAMILPRLGRRFRYASFGGSRGNRPAPKIAVTSRANCIACSASADLASVAPLMIRCARPCTKEVAARII